MNQPLYFKVILLLNLLFVQLPIVAQHNPADIDPSFAMGSFNNEVLESIVQPDDKILVVGRFTTFKSKAVKNLIRLNADGSIDNSFNIGSGTNGDIYSVALQADGKILIGGDFTQYNGTSINRFARLNADGSFDNTFNTGTGPNNRVSAIAVQTDGKILISGAFSKYNGFTRNYFARINSDGSHDNTLPVVSISPGNDKKILIQPSDNKILITGDYSIIRLNADGTSNASFTFGAGVVEDVAIQTDGKIIIVGTFKTYGAFSKNGIVRINNDGSVDNSFVSGSGFIDGAFVGMVRSVQIQLDGKIIIGGSTTRYNGISYVHAATIRLNTDGTFDNSFIISQAKVNYDNLAVMQSTGKVIIFKGSNYFYPAYTVFRLNQDGSFDENFLISSGTDDDVTNFDIQKDGKILVVGSFKSVNDITSNHVARLNSNGTVDTSFSHILNPNYIVSCVKAQSDGKIIIAGDTTSASYYVTGRINRLNTDGSIDLTFNTPAFGGKVKNIFFQPDGKIIIVGQFTIISGGDWYKNLARLNTDGSIDPSFNKNVYGIYSGQISCAARQNDGKIIIVGGFYSYGQSGQIPLGQIARLNQDASLDTTFKTGTGFNGGINSCVIQKDNKIVVGGFTTSFNGVTIKHITRLNPDGSIDSTFSNSSGPDASILSLTLDKDEKILVTGLFNSYDGYSRRFFSRLNSNGTLDLNFDPGASFETTKIYKVFVQTDGKILVGGEFDSYQDYPAFNLVRLNGEPVYYNTIRGKIYSDANNDCTKQLTEKAIPSMIIKTLPGPYYTYSDRYGDYSVKVDTGSAVYTLSQQFNSIQSKILVNKCALTQSVTLSGASKDTCCFNFGDSTKSCALLNISIQNTQMRRCMRNVTYINYCNYGNGNTANVQIRVDYPSHMIPISSSPMWSSKNGSTLIYDAGTLNAGDCKTISIIDSVKCGDESIRGLTQCIKASISPASDCSVGSGWDNSTINVTGNCVNDTVHFIVLNEGTGSMISNRSYRMYVNDTLIYTGNFKLNNGENFTVSYPAAGNTIRLEADQHALYPYRSIPRSIVESCGSETAGYSSQGLVTTAPQDDINEEVAITCNIIRDSYDPNDKQTIPSGIGALKQVAPGEELEYTIRFQNTGNDVAYTVKIVDTLDTSLDIASFKMGASSHPYTFQLTGKGQAVLTYTFTNINLIDSTTDDLKSRGLISFRIRIPSSIPLGTVIRNKSYIYFDYNSPIITNETMHTVGITVQQDLLKGVNVDVSSINSKPVVVAASPLPQCTPSSIDLTNQNMTIGSTPALTYSYFNNQEATVPVLTPTQISTSGIYYIVGKDNFGSSDTTPVNVVILPKPIVHITDPAPKDFPSTINLNLPAVTLGSTNGLTYTYYLDAGATSILPNANAVTSSGRYYIVGMDATGCSDTSSVEVVINLVSEINDFTALRSVKFYPNPVTNFLTIEIPQEGSNRVLKIYSTTGALVESVNLHNTQIQQVSLNLIKIGNYNFEIWQDNERVAIGTLQIE